MNKTIGIIGGGQLGRMLTDAAHKLAFKVIVIDPTPNCPAAQAGAEQIIAELNDETALRQLASKSDFLTIEIEHFDTEILKKIAEDGTPVNPDPSSVHTIQNKFYQKQFLTHHDIPVAEFADFESVAQANDYFNKWGGQIYIKAKYNAFDGRANWYITKAKFIEEWAKGNDISMLYLEKHVGFLKELSVIVARDVDGNIKSYPVTQTVHKRSICIETYTPTDLPQHIIDNATRLAEQTVQLFDGAGVFGVEMFLTTNFDQILINEVAPRVHNSGHYTMDACTTSQFEQHIRAITGMKLGDTKMTVPAAVMVNILGDRDGPVELNGTNEAEAISGVKIHLYGKSPTKVDRKMGHINVNGATIEEARKKARKARGLISL